LNTLCLNTALLRIVTMTTILPTALCVVVLKIQWGWNNPKQLWILFCPKKLKFYDFVQSYIGSPTLTIWFSFISTLFFWIFCSHHSYGCLLQVTLGLFLLIKHGILVQCSKNL
jgi:hypothetical protein